MSNAVAERHGDTTEDRANAAEHAAETFDRLAENHEGEARRLRDMAVTYREWAAQFRARIAEEAA